MLDAIPVLEQDGARYEVLAREGDTLVCVLLGTRAFYFDAPPVSPTANQDRALGEAVEAARE